MKKLTYIYTICTLFIISCSNNTEQVLFLEGTKTSCDKIVETADAIGFVLNLQIENNSSKDILINIKDINKKESAFKLVTHNRDTIPIKINARQTIFSLSAKSAYLLQGTFSKALFWKSIKNSSTISELKQSKIIYISNMEVIRALAAKETLYTITNKEISLAKIVFKDDENPIFIPEIRRIK